MNQKKKPKRPIKNTKKSKILKIEPNKNYEGLKLKKKLQTKKDPKNLTK